MSEDPAAKIAARLTELWRTSRPTVLERMAILHAACDSLTANRGDSQARTQAIDAAHKLSGVLGVFGLPRGSQIASSIETLLAGDEYLTTANLFALHGRVAELDAVIASRPDH
jgi:HPt (histidine-containing phosphotransfer) domain-containing protein